MLKRHSIGQGNKEKEKDDQMGGYRQDDFTWGLFLCCLSHPDAQVRKTPRRKPTTWQSIAK